MNTSNGKHKSLSATAAVLCLLTMTALVTAASTEQSNQVSITATVSASAPAKVQQVNANEVMIQIGKFPQGGSPGEPMLPYKAITLLAPPDANLATATAGLVSGNWEDLAGTYEIAAVKPAATSQEGRTVISWGVKDVSKIINGRDSDIYGTDAYFPARPVQIVSVGKFRQWKLVELRVWLAAYNPVQKKVRVLKDAQTQLNVSKLSAAQAVGLDAAILPAMRNTEKFIPELKAKIDNLQDIETFYGAGAKSGDIGPLFIPADYVIITTSTIVNNSTKLANFKAAKTAAGFTVLTVAQGPVETDVNYISGATLDARANNIRTWLVNHYLGDGIQYVLLIGNPSTNGAVGNISLPMKKCWPRSASASDSNCPTDMFFAELSGNWDFDGDNQFGEFNGDYGVFGGADKNCEVKIGRIPVYNANCVDLDAILQKCIDYDTATGSKVWRSKVLVPAAISNFGPQDETGDGVADWPFLNSSDRTFGDDWGEAIKSLANSNSVSPYTLYEKSGVYGDGSAYPLTACNAALNNANFINEWKNQYGFVTWWAHGNATSASQFTWTTDTTFPFITGNQSPHLETTFTTLISNANCASLDDNTPSFVVQVSCENGWPENSTNLGFSLLKHGAIGTICGTRVTWYAIGSWGTGNAANVGDNASYGYYCFDRMANSGEDIGTALVYCRSNFGTNWADGASWMNMVGFNIYGDPTLKLGIMGSTKWKQPPDESEKGMDVRCDRTDGIPRLLADDFLCTRTGPITKITLWGSWFNDNQGFKGVINDIHLSIHNDKPSQGTGDHSEPNELLWETTIGKAHITETLYKEYLYEYWWDPYFMTSPIYPGDTQIWQYDINIPSDQFIQQGDPCHPIIYWLDAYVELDMNVSPPMAQFGWKTSSQHWNDDSVRQDFITLQWLELRYPPPHPECPNSIDLAFAIYTGEGPKAPMKHLKWSQPPIEVAPAADNVTFCGWDEKSFNADEYNPHGPFRMVADDFRCLGTMPITSIHWWGSYFDWEQGPGFPPVMPTGWWIGFWSNQPQGQFPFSYPNVLLHSFIVDANRVEIEQVGTDTFLGYYPNDICYQYTLNLNPEEVFRQNDFNSQTQDNVFWLSIVAVYPISPGYIYNPWGWKTRPWHWMDDAITVNLPVIPAQGYTIDPLIDPVTPLIDPIWGNSMDVSFELDTDPNYIKWEQDFNGIRTWPHYEDVNSTKNMIEPANEHLVADDWRCVRRTPVTAIVWWGSYIGYQYEACGTPFMQLPVKPDRFRLTIWTDVNAGSDQNYPYSHPGYPIWEYMTDAFDEVLVGYDKHPEQTLPIRTEPVFRYSVRLPVDRFFHQPDYNEVFWLSIQAVYDTSQPNYLWGWTNHQHAFNDDAVQGYFDPDRGGQWFWSELYDQTQTSEDMSFVLFTDPNVCSTCANYNCDSIVNFIDYTDFADNWLAIVPPGGYDNSDLNCDGIIDLLDLKIFTLQWLGYCP